MFLFVLALWAVVELRRKPGWDLALLCGLAAAPAAQARPVFMVVPFVVLAFGLVCRPGMVRFFRSIELYVLIAVMALFLAGHYSWMFSLHFGTEEGASYSSLLEISPGAVWRGLAGGAILLDAGITPPAYLLLGLLGTVAAFRWNRRRAVLIVGAFLFFLYVYAARSTYYTEALRFSVSSQVFLATLSGVGLACLSELLAHVTGRAVANWSAPILLLGTSFLSREPYTNLTEQEFEYLFLQSAYKTLPARCTLVKSDQFMGNGTINSPFPFYEFRYRVPGPGLEDVELIEASQFAKERQSVRSRCILYYRGIACSVFQSWEQFDSLGRIECSNFEKQQTLGPIIEKIINSDSITESGRQIVGPEVLVGFYSIHSQ